MRGYKGAVRGALREIAKALKAQDECVRELADRQAVI
jgi:hypothetical protein